MNQEQRKYLVSKIEETFKRQKSRLEEEIPTKPSMNRYLIGALLDGSAKIIDPKKIKENLKKHVLELGKEEFVEEDRWNNKRGEVMKIPPGLVIEMPKSFLIDMETWKKKNDEIRKKIKDLDAQREVLVLKINIGSSVILDKLINQVDSLGDLDLFSNKLTLIAEDIGEKQKQLPSSKKEK